MPGPWEKYAQTPAPAAAAGPWQKYGAPAEPAASAPEAPAETSLVSDFIKNSPIGMVKGLADALNQVYEGKNPLRGQAEENVKLLDAAKGSYAKGDYTAAAAHFLNYLLPGGAAMDEAGRDFQKGEIAHGTAKTAGIASNLLTGKYAPRVMNTITEPNIIGRTARAAVERVADALPENLPKVPPAVVDAIGVLSPRAAHAAGLANKGVKLADIVRGALKPKELSPTERILASMTKSNAEAQRWADLPTAAEVEEAAPETKAAIEQAAAEAAPAIPRAAIDTAPDARETLTPEMQATVDELRAETHPEASPATPPVSDPKLARAIAEFNAARRARKPNGAPEAEAQAAPVSDLEKQLRASLEARGVKLTNEEPAPAADKPAGAPFESAYERPAADAPAEDAAARRDRFQRAAQTVKGRALARWLANAKDPIAYEDAANPAVMTPERWAQIAAEAGVTKPSATSIGIALEEYKRLRGVQDLPEVAAARERFADSLGGQGIEPAPPAGTAPRPGAVVKMKPGDIAVDPARFQFKANTGGASGTGDELKAVKKYDPELGGVLSVWHDPATGKTYVVNGHHRLELANRAGADHVIVRYLDAENATDARTKGAIINIAEGRGSALDAAKVFRDSEMTPEHLQDLGVSPRGAVARDGLNLSRLAPSIFDHVVQGNLPVKRASIIGEMLPEYADQQAALDLLDRAEGRGKSISDDQFRELVDLVRGAPKKAAAADQNFSLFGDVEPAQESAVLEMASLSDYIRKRLQGEKKVFSTVADAGKSKMLEEAGNKLQADANARAAEGANRDLAVYDKLKSSAGPIHDVLRADAQALGKGGPANEIKAHAFAAIRAHIQQLVGNVAGTP